ncbi:MAG: isoleucine--tRNA ligase [Candidatus Kinetoplastibacterium crithidii]|nr:isoleucine--tRNA ligase [Candidatus Kinetoplastibacterium crithidii]
MDYKNTLNLLDTSFQMRGNLPKKEPEWLKKWEDQDIYNVIRQSCQGRQKFTLHDGPPYANGNIHLGHAVNKVLKDIIIKSKTMSGYDAHYIPGWDCHGMPIEIQIEKKFGKHLSTKDIQNKARLYAKEQVEKQKQEFKRLGILGNWENPYLTMNFKNEANEIRVLKRIMESGFIFRGLRPINWCFDCKSALAEAEIEYYDKKDDAIYVAFESTNTEQLSEIFNYNINICSAIIWTTTPWTIPANQFLSVHPDIEYALIKTNSDRKILSNIIVAKDRINYFLEQTNLKGNILSITRGSKLEKHTFSHPFCKLHNSYNRTSPVLIGKYVTTDTGTGIVHSAPAHGLDDFNVFKKNGFSDSDILNLITESGAFMPEVPLLENISIWDANKKIIEMLLETGNLVKQEIYQHSYMHCWRHKTPVIFKSTHQWFAGLDIKSDDNKTIREIALDNIEKTTFYPSWGKDRLKAMIANRPDWTISRQRQWGVPMALLLDKVSKNIHPDTMSLLEIIAQRIESGGIEEWQNIDCNNLIDNKTAEEYEKSSDTLDVWFDSGSTHLTVIGGKDNEFNGTHSKELEWPADLYLEGSDQHRGWFHSSLLIGCMLYKQAPYKALLTHGFVVDGQGKKMSKSLGNIISPQKICDSLGADILRLWIASSDYSSELSISKEILDRTVEGYRRIRNTIRFLLLNISDFDHKNNYVEYSNLFEIDKYALVLTSRIQEEILQYYEKYEFHKIVSKIQKFCSEDLGAFYLDILKDRLYTTPVNSLARRSAQTALLEITQVLLKTIAPILSFTSEEAWQELVNSTMPSLKNEHDTVTIFTQLFQKLDIEKDYYLYDKWFSIRKIRDIVQRKLEEARAEGEIGSSLQAEIDIYANYHDKKILESLESDLNFIFIVSKANLIDTTEQETTIIVRSSKHKKCERCWHRREDVGNNKYKNICNRCIQNLFENGEKRNKA